MPTVELAIDWISHAFAARYYVDAVILTVFIWSVKS